MDLKTLYYQRRFFGAFSTHLQSCRLLHSFIFEQKSLEKSLPDNIK